uniref:diguanylate cyclase domain-containing protein n=1 Tax=Thaumasiovibrio occultus TaxID=1891184 RepID=UPI000B35B082|nr:diguanylate cyclase [Thaumasiovibrio occultus]
MGHRYHELPLRYKMLLPTWLTVMFVIVGVGSVAIKLLSNSQYEALDQRVMILSQGVANTLDAALMFDDAQTAREQLTILTFDPDIIAAKVLQGNDNKLVSIRRLPDDCLWDKDVVTCNTIPYTQRETNIMLGDETLGKLVVWVSENRVAGKVKQMWGALAAISLTMSFFAWLLAKLLHSLIVTPLTSLHRSMEEMTDKGVVKRKLPIYQDDEIGKLTRCFNEMVSSLSEREHELQLALKYVEQRNRYIHGALDVMKRGVMVLSTDGEVIYRNPLISQDFDCTDCDTDIRSILERVVEPRQAIDTLMRAVAEHRSVQGIEVRTTHTGRQYKISSHPMESELHSLIQFEDISEQYLAESRRKLIDLMFEQNQDAVMVISRDYTVQMQNAASIAWFGRIEKAENLPLKTESKSVGQQMKLLLRNGLYVSQVELFINGRKQPCMLRLRTLKNEQGRVEAFVLSLSDLSAEVKIKRLSHAVNHDALTGLANRAKVMSWMNRLHANEESQYIVFLDLDGFKSVNDNYGHAVGDEVLKVVARRLEQCVSGKHLVARLSGDEFLLAIEHSEPIVPMLESIIHTLAHSIDINGYKCHVTASVGVSYWHGQSAEPLDHKITEADIAMYVAKRKGKNQYHIEQSTQQLLELHC